MHQWRSRSESGNTMLSPLGLAFSRALLLALSITRTRGPNGATIFLCSRVVADRQSVLVFGRNYCLTNKAVQGYQRKLFIRTHIAIAHTNFASISPWLCKGFLQWQSITEPIFPSISLTEGQREYDPRLVKPSLWRCHQISATSLC